MKKVLYIVLGVVTVVVILCSYGVNKFNKTWFADRPHYLSFNADLHSFPFDWAEQTIAGNFEAHAAMMIRIKIDGLAQVFHMQFDTGAPNTVINGKTLDSLEGLGIKTEDVIHDGTRYVKDFNFSIGENKVDVSQLKIIEGYGGVVEGKDTSRIYKLGTIGADFLCDKITAIDFKNQMIYLYDERTEWMNSLGSFENFNFRGRRFMLPSEIADKDLELFYDSGASAFGVITTRKRYRKYSNKDTEEVIEDLNSWGNTMHMRHKETSTLMKMNHQGLSLRRVSYFDKYAAFQGLITPFTRIGGWLGNRPFLDHTLILDTKKEEFMLVKGSIEGKGV